MPELPWYKRFPQDWLSDPGLGRCSPAARGVWADIVDTLYLLRNPYLTGPAKELSRLCRCSEEEFNRSIAELKKHAVGEFGMTDGQHKIACRRILREFNNRELKRKAGLASATARQHHPQQPEPTQHPTDTPTEGSTPSAYASASVSASESWEGIQRETNPQETFALVENLKGRIFSLYDRPVTQHLSGQDESLLCQVAGRAGVIEEMRSIERHFGRAAGKERKFLPQSVSSFIRKWDETVDAARTLKDIPLGENAEEGLAMKLMKEACRNITR